MKTFITPADKSFLKGNVKNQMSNVKSATQNLKLEKYLIWLLIIFFGLLYALWSVNRHNHFRTDAVDLGIFDQPMWLFSQGKAPLSTVKWNQSPGAHILGDHFHPILFVFSSLYWLWDDVRVLLVVQALFVVLAAYPIYLAAKRILERESLALAIAFSYLSFIGVQTAIDYDFHETALAALPLAISLYALTFEKWRLYFLSFALGLLFKEDMPLMYAGVGLFAILFWGIGEIRDIREKKGKRLLVGLVTLGVSVAYYFFVTKVAIPYFKGDAWRYEELDPRIGKTTFDLIKASLTRPWVVIQVMFTPVLKLKTMLNYLASFGFLPLLNPASLAMLLPNFVSRFLTDLPQRWLIRYQYSVNIAPALAFGTIFGVDKLLRVLSSLKALKKLPVILFIFIICCSLLQTFRTNTPLFRMLDPKNYRWESRFGLNNKLLAQIPKDASVMAQSAFVPHLSHRDIIYRYEDNLIKTARPDFVLMSADEASDPPYARRDLETKIEILRKSSDYKTIYWDGVRLLMKKKTGGEV